MSRENVEVVRAIYDRVLAKGRLTEAVSDVIPELFDPEIEVQQMEGFMGTAGTFHGYEGLRRSTLELLRVFDDFHIVPERHFEAGDSVVTFARGRGRGRSSGVEVDTLVGHLWQLRAGRVVRLVVYPTPNEALEAVGLQE